MDKIKQGMRKISQAFLPVNAFAGKLRALLGVLLIFILWTFNAQNKSLPVDGFIRLQPQGGFIANILLDLAGRYFHPATLGLTFAPCILLFMARQQIAILLKQVYDTGIKTAQKFLDQCAFSTNAVSIAACDLSQQTRDPQALSVHAFGGPAKVTLSASAYLILRSSLTQRYQLVHCLAQEQPCTLNLTHQQHVAGTIPFSHLTFPLPAADDREFVQIRLQIIPSENTTQNGLVIMEDISTEDAQFLLKTAQPDKVILPLMGNEIQRFLNSLDEDLPASQANSKHRPSAKPNQQLKRHSNYAQLAALFLPRKRWFARPRKHALYSGAITCSHTAKQTAYPLADQMLIGLEAHVQREMVSFFNLEKIQFTIKN
jgi:hypothetical protein